MGVHNREYMRDEAGARSLFAPHRMTWWFIGIHATLWLILLIAFNAEQRGFLRVLASDPGLAGFVYRHLFLHPEQVIESLKLWQPFTAFWFHHPASVGDLFWPMLLLFFFGRDVEAALGSRRYLWLYLGGGLVAMGVYAVLGYLVGPHAPAWGARGGLFAVMVWAAFHRPQRVVHLMMVLPVPLWVLVGVLMVGLEVLNVTSSGGVSMLSVAHLAGAGWGWFFWTRFQHFGGSLQGPGAWLVKLKQRRAADEEEVQQASEAEQRTRVDTLLAKIHADGIGALTEEEKAFLQEASKRYK